MTSIFHSTFGLVASLLAAAGFNRIANYIDMKVQGLSGDVQVASAPALPCVVPCDSVMAPAIPCVVPCDAVFGDQA